MPSKKYNITIACKQCGNNFHPYSNLSKFCSIKCNYDYKRENAKERSRRVKSVIKTCIICNKEFHPYSNSSNKFCSLDCANKNRRNIWEEKNRIKCIICGNEFIKANNKQKYCSHKCAGIGITQMNKEKINIKSWERRKASGKTNHLDNLWRYKVYELAEYKCEYCGKEGQLNAHHIFSRSNYSVRWDIDNGICLCVAHHIFGNLSFHKSPAEMIEWIKNKRGEQWYNDLLIKVRRSIKPNDAKELYKPLLEGGQYDKFKRFKNND